MKGAPIRFVVAVLGGWTCVRLAVLLPDAAPLALAGDVLAPAAQAMRRPAAPVIAPALSRPTPAPNRLTAARHTVPTAPVRGSSKARTAPQATVVDGSEPVRPAAPRILVAATLGQEPSTTSPRRWSASAWLLARGGAGGTLSGGQLGASQAGARLLYRISDAHRLSLSGRIATPLKGRGGEAAIGVDWQPTAAPVHLVAEQRVGLDGARGGPTAMVIGGLNPTPIVAGFRLEAYAQGGAILRGGRVEGFGDGAARVTRPVAALGRATVDLGAGAWAAGQRGVTRADVGPTIGVALPVAGRGVRLSLDWRQRVAGRARPGSGPALSIGSDF